MLEQLKQILGKILPEVDMSKVTEETKLMEELGFDSLALMMLAMELEDAFGFRFEQFVQFETVGDVCAYLQDKV